MHFTLNGQTVCLNGEQDYRAAARQIASEIQPALAVRVKGRTLPLTAILQEGEEARCGDYNQGVVLLKHPGCETSLAVPYSCKTRTCPSCMTRRSEDLALTLGDILPRVPYRLW